jgi:hypothetical protein
MSIPKVIELIEVGYKYRIDISGEDLVRIQLINDGSDRPYQEISFAPAEAAEIIKAIQYVTEGFDE